MYDIIYIIWYHRFCMISYYSTWYWYHVPFNVTTDFDLQGDCLVWCEHPQLCINYTLCPTGAKGPWFSASYKEVTLVYFSTFEPIWSDSWQHHAAGWSAHALWLGQQPAPALPLNLTCSKCAGERLRHSWKCLHRHAAGLGQLQQGLRGEHLDKVYCRGRPQMVSMVEAERIRS